MTKTLPTLLLTLLVSGGLWADSTDLKCDEENDEFFGRIWITINTEIESIYTKHEERVNGLTNFTKINSEEIGNWFQKKRSKYNTDMNFGDVFIKERDQELKNLLKDKKANLSGRLVSLEFYLQSLQNVVSIISSDYKTID